MAIAVRTCDGVGHCCACRAVADCYIVTAKEWGIVQSRLRSKARCPCCPGAEHDGGQPFEVALAAMRRDRGEQWRRDGEPDMNSIWMTVNGVLRDKVSVGTNLDDCDTEATDWRKVEP